MFCRSFREVFQSYPAAITDPVEHCEQIAEIDFARAGLVATRIVGDLDMSNAAEICLDRARQFTLCALGVIDVEKHLQVGSADKVLELKCYAR